MLSKNENIILLNSTGFSNGMECPAPVITSKFALIAFATSSRAVTLHDKSLSDAKSFIGHFIFVKSSSVTFA